MTKLLSGEHGPKFVGYAGPKMRQWLLAQFAFGLGVGTAVFILMVMFE